MKKHICIFLMFCMVWGMLPIGSMAEESGESLQSVVGVDSTTELVYMATGTPPPSSGGSPGGGGGYTTSVPAPTPTPTPTSIPTMPPSTGGSGGGGGGGVYIPPKPTPVPTSTPPSTGGGGGGYIPPTPTPAPTFIPTMPPIISVSTATVQRGTDTTVAISIQPNSGMATGSLILNYDNDYLNAYAYIVDGVVKDASPMVNLSYINPVTGKKAAKLSWMGLSPLNAGGVLIRVHFHLSANAADGAVLPLTLSDIILVDADAEPVEYVIKIGSITVCDYVLGDANGDQVVNILDAFSVLRYDAGLVPYTDRQKSAADVNKDGAVDIYDAMLVQRYDLGLGGWLD